MRNLFPHQYPHTLFLFLSDTAWFFRLDCFILSHCATVCFMRTGELRACCLASTYIACLFSYTGNGLELVAALASSLRMFISSRARCLDTYGTTIPRLLTHELLRPANVILFMLRKIHEAMHNAKKHHGKKRNHRHQNRHAEKKAEKNVCKCTWRKLKALEERTCFHDLFVFAGKIPSHDARVDAGADDLARVELHLEHP